MNGMKRLARGQRALAADCIAECWVFISKADVVRAIAVFKFRRVANRERSRESYSVRDKNLLAFRRTRSLIFPRLPRARKLYPMCGWSIKSLIFQRILAELFRSRLS